MKLLPDQRDKVTLAERRSRIRDRVRPVQGRCAEFRVTTQGAQDPWAGGAAPRLRTVRTVSVSSILQKRERGASTASPRSPSVCAGRGVRGRPEKGKQRGDAKARRRAWAAQERWRGASNAVQTWLTFFFPHRPQWYLPRDSSGGGANTLRAARRPVAAARSLAARRRRPIARRRAVHVHGRKLLALASNRMRRGSAFFSCARPARHEPGRVHATSQPRDMRSGATDRRA